MDAVGQTVKCLRSKVRKGHQHPPVRSADDVPFLDIQLVHRHPGQLVGVFQDLLLQDQARLGDGKAAHVGLPGGVGAQAEGGHIRILVRNHVHIRVILQADDLRRHLGVGGVSALANLRFAHLQLDGAVLVEDHAAGGMLQGDGPYACIVPEAGEADPLADGAGLILEFLPALPVVHVSDGLVHALVEGIEVVLVLGEAVLEANGHDVLAAILHGVQTQGLAHVVRMAFIGEHGLGDAVAPHGARYGLVGIDRVGVALHVGAGVHLRETAHALGGDGMAVGGVGALVGEHFKLSGHIGAVGPHVGDDVELDGVTDPIADEGVLPGDVDLHQPTAQLPADPGAEGLVQGVLLVAEAAADVGFDDADGAPGHPDGLAHRAAHDMGDLGGGHHHGLARLLIGVADKVFDVAMLHRGRSVPLVDTDEALLFPGFLIVAVADGGVLQDVVGEGIVELGLAILHGLDGVQHEGQRLVFHLHKPGGLSAGHLVFRHHRRHVVAVVANVLVQQ